jgi:hypothetical protein
MKSKKKAFKNRRKIKLDEPWKCECGKLHELNGYVAAHWREGLTHRCECGRKHSLCNGVLTLID